jgi:hypothetical protein
MSLMDHTTAPAPRFERGGHIYVGRPPAPLTFPAEEEVPETVTSFEQRVALYESVKDEVAATCTVGSDQFMYWNPQSAKWRCAPDLFVKLGIPNRAFDVWKVWERGVPELAVEIVSKSDRPEDEWIRKFDRYEMCGVLELVRFDAEDTEQMICVYDRVEGELVERAGDDPARLACHALGLWWTVVDMPGLGPSPRLARDRAGTDLLLTPAEDRARAEQERARAEQERAAEADARARAEQDRAAEADARARAEQDRARAEQERAAEADARARAEQERDALLKELEALRAAGSRAPGTERKPEVKALPKRKAGSPAPRRRKA